MDEGTNNIIDPFLQAAQKHPGKTALINGSEKISYGELLENAAKKAACFQRKGITKGDRVLVFIPMSIELYETVLALFYMGAVAVFLDEWVNKKRLELCCSLAQCKGFIAPAKIRLLGWTSKEIRKIPVWLKTNNYAQAKTACTKVAANDQALITFTTGSTGIPKAADRTHGFLQQQFKALLSEVKPNVNDVDMPVLPIVLLMNLGAGCTSVIPAFSSSKPQLTDFTKITGEIKNNNVNRIECSPDFILRLSDFILQNKTSLPSIKKIFTGGAPVFPKEAEKIIRAFPNAEVHIVYGSTEAEPIGLIDAKELAQSKDILYNSLPAGKVHRGTQVLIIPIKDEPLEFPNGERFRSFALQPGQVGEIIVSGKHVLSHYLHHPEAEKRNKIWVDGVCWHRTGDSGWLDEKGNLFLCGRSVMVFEKNGIHYYPFIIEKMIKESGLSPMGTIMHINQQVVVFAEGAQHQKNAIEGYLKDGGILFDRLVVLKKIPRDKRHFSKIEYSLLAAYAVK